MSNTTTPISTNESDHRKWYNRFHRQPRLFKGRTLHIKRATDGTLQLIDKPDAVSQRAISPELQTRFLHEVIQAAARWHNSGDVFAQGATACVYFKGNGATILQLRRVLGVRSWKQLRHDHVGAVERMTNGLRGPRRRISALGGDCSKSRALKRTA